MIKPENDRKAEGFTWPIFIFAVIEVSIVSKIGRFSVSMGVEMVRIYKNGFSLKKNHFTTQISKRFASYRHFDRGNSVEVTGVVGVSPFLWYFRYIASIFFTLHKRLWLKLVTNKAKCLKRKKINKSMYFKRFLATNNKYNSVIAHSTHWIDIWAYRKYLWNPPHPTSTIQSWHLTPYCGPKVHNLTQTRIWVKDNTFYALFPMFTRT
jgi:hypothetical protein